jgi:hypothetical protein
MRMLLLLALVAGCGAQPPPRGLLAGPVQKRAHCPEGLHLSLTDALGDHVKLGAPDQREVTVMVFMSRGGKDEAADFLRSLDERLLNEPVESVGVVDVRKYSGLMKPLAEHQLSKAAGDGRDKRRKRREERGLDASAESVDRWHLIGDFDGKVLEKFGVEPEPQHPLGFVVDKCGQVGGPHKDVDGLISAVDQAMSGSKRAGARRLRASR